MTEINEPAAATASASLHWKLSMTRGSRRHGIAPCLEIITAYVYMRDGDGDSWVCKWMETALAAVVAK